VVLTASPVLGLVTAREGRPAADTVVPGLVLSGMRSAEVVADFLRAGIAGVLTGVRLVVVTVGRAFARMPETGCGGRREACGRSAVSVHDGLVISVAEGGAVSVFTSSPSERKDGSSAGE
jgi:PIN domain nuclease of toxin-antitoxin system